MNVTPVTQIKVGLDFGDGAIDVGRLALRERTVYFEYDTAFLSRGLDISPLRLSLCKGYLGERHILNLHLL